MSRDCIIVLPVGTVDKCFNSVHEYCVLITPIRIGDGEMLVCITGQISYFYNIEASALPCIKNTHLGSCNYACEFYLSYFNQYIKHNCAITIIQLSFTNNARSLEKRH